MSLPPLCFVMSHLQNRATGHWLLMSVSVSSILDRLLLALTYFARCLDDNTSPSCKLGAAVHLQSQSLMNLVNPEEDQTTGLIFSGFLQLLLLRTCSRNQPVVNFGGAEERCALFFVKTANWYVTEEEDLLENSFWLPPAGWLQTSFLHTYQRMRWKPKIQLQRQQPYRCGVLGWKCYHDSWILLWIAHFFSIQFSYHLSHTPVKWSFTICFLKTKTIGTVSATMDEVSPRKNINEDFSEKPLFSTSVKTIL